MKWFHIRIVLFKPLLHFCVIQYTYFSLPIILHSFPSFLPFILSISLPVFLSFLIHYPPNHWCFERFQDTFFFIIISFKNHSQVTRQLIFWEPPISLPSSIFNEWSPSSLVTSVLHYFTFFIQPPIYLSLLTPINEQFPSFHNYCFHPSTHPSIFHPIIHPSTHSFVHPSTHSSIHSSIHSFIHPLIYQSTHSYIYSFIHRLIYQSTHSFIHPLIHPSIHSFIHPSTHSFIHPSTHSFIHPLIYPSAHSSIYSFIHSSLPLLVNSYIYLFIHPSIYPSVHLSIHSSIHLLIHPFISSFVSSFIYLFIFSFSNLRTLFPGSEDVGFGRSNNRRHLLSYKKSENPGSN